MTALLGWVRGPGGVLVGDTDLDGTDVGGWVELVLEEVCAGPDEPHAVRAMAHDTSTTPGRIIRGACAERCRSRYMKRVAFHSSGRGHAE
jgi:hypothetical protein